MAAQTSYTDSVAAGFEGARADAGPIDVLGRINGDSSEIPFGRAVCFDTGDREVDLPAATSDKVVGIALASMAYQPGATLGTSGIAADAQVNVLRRGRVYLTCEEDVVPGDRLHVRAVAGAGGSVLGKFRKTAVTGETINTSANVLVLETATAGNVFAADVDFGVGVAAEITAAFSTWRTALAAAVLAADSSGTVATFESTLITAINAITLP